MKELIGMTGECKEQLDDKNYVPLLLSPTCFCYLEEGFIEVEHCKPCPLAK